MKKELFLMFVTAMLSVMGAKAEVIPASYYSEPAGGTFYLYNVTQQQFLTGSPAMSATPVAMTLSVVDENKYSIAPTSGGFLKMGYWNNQYLWNNAWAETGFFKWSFTADGTKTYNLSITATADADNYFTNGTTYYLNTVNTAPSTEAAPADEWALITEANYYSYLASAASIPAKYYTTTPTVGTYYLYNIEKCGFVYRGGDGNYAGLKETPAPLKLTSAGEGAFYIQFSDGKYLKTGEYSGCYVWTDATTEEFAWTFESFHGVSGLFLVKCPLDEVDRYLYSNGIGKRGVNGWTAPDANKTNYAWALISATDYPEWQNSNKLLSEVTGYSAESDVDNMYVSVLKSMTANVWNTFVVPFDMAIPSGWTVKEPTAFDGSTLTFSDAASIMAGKPYIVKPTSAVTSFSATGVTLKKDLDPTTVGTGTTVTMAGTYSAIAAVPTDSYIIGIKNGESAFYKVNSDVSLKPFRAYFTVAAGAGARISLNFDDETTGIKNLTPAIPEGEGVVYDLQGRKVTQPTKGLYIVNGKKVMVK